MHRALQIPEVFAEIVDHLGKGLHIGSLVNLAVARKSFSYPALSCLWYSIHIVPFVALLGDALGMCGAVGEEEAPYPDDDEDDPPTKVMMASIF